MPNYIGIDFGLKNVGLAIGQSITRTASALETVHVKNKWNWDKLDKIIQQWQPSAIIIGKPIDEEGKEQLITKQAHNFAKKVINRYKLPVHEVDERYSSLQAQNDFAQARAQGSAKKKHIKNIDAHAAKNILQRWLDNQ